MLRPVSVPAGGVCGRRERGARCVGGSGQDPRLLGCASVCVLPSSVGLLLSTAAGHRKVVCGRCWTRCATFRVRLGQWFARSSQPQLSTDSLCGTSGTPTPRHQLVFTLPCHARCCPACCRARAQRRVAGRHRQAADGCGEPCFFVVLLGFVLLGRRSAAGAPSAGRMSWLMHS